MLVSLKAFIFFTLKITLWTPYCYEWFGAFRRCLRASFWEPYPLDRPGKSISWISYSSTIFYAFKSSDFLFCSFSFSSFFFCNLLYLSYFLRKCKFLFCFYNNSQTPRWSLGPIKPQNHSSSIFSEAAWAVLTNSESKDAYAPKYFSSL